MTRLLLFIFLISLHQYSIIAQDKEKGDTLTAPEENLDEVVVSTVFRNASLRNTPLAMEVVSQKKIDATTAMNIIDALTKNTTGVAALKTGPNISKPFIRGLGYNRVLTLYDGIRQEGQQWGDEHGLEVDDYNLGRMEIIKGPASLMYGSDALAGVVSILSPAFVAKENGVVGKFTSEYQSNNGLFGSGIRLLFSKDRWYFKVGGSVRLAHNYRNKADGLVYATNFQTYNGFAGIQYKSKLGFTSLQYTIFDNLQAIPDGSRDSLTRVFTYQDKEGREDHDKHRPMVTDQMLHTYHIPILHQRIQYQRIIIDNEYKLGKGFLKALIGLTQSRRREFLHPTRPNQPSLHLQLNTLNYNIRYQLPTLVNKIDITVGSTGMIQGNNSFHDATDFPIPNYLLGEVGAYVMGKIKVGDKIHLLAGIRYDVRLLQIKDLFVDTTNIDFPKAVLPNSTLNLDHQYRAGKYLFSGLSTSLGVSYQIINGLVLKANFSRGYRAPNITELSAAGLDPGAHLHYQGLGDKAKSEFSNQIDLGIEYYTHPDFNFSVSGFYNFLQNYIYFTLEQEANGALKRDAQGNRFLKYQQSNAHLYGIESNLSIHPNKWTGWRWDHSFYYILGANLAPQFKGKGSTGGQYLPLVPPLHYGSTLSKRINTHNKILPYVSLAAETEIVATQNRYFGLEHTETRTLGYDLWNFTASLHFIYTQKRTQNNTLDLQITLNNAFNRVYQSHLNRLKYAEIYDSRITNHNLRSGIYNMGRNLAIKLIVPF